MSIKYKLKLDQLADLITAHKRARGALIHASEYTQAADKHRPPAQP